MEDLSSYAETLLQRFIARGVLVDTNLLLLYAIGEYDPSIIARSSFDRLSAYSLEDLQLLRGLMSLFRSFVTTPHVLAEVSNWIGYLPRQQEVECLRRFHNVFQEFTEIYTRSVDLSAHERFPYLGLTDTALASVASDYLVLSDDARLVGHLNQMGLEALNINHLRQELWLRG